MLLGVRKSHRLEIIKLSFDLSKKETYARPLGKHSICEDAVLVPKKVSFYLPPKHCDSGLGFPLRFAHPE